LILMVAYYFRLFFHLSLLKIAKRLLKKLV
jgi:hypothetical protein